MGIFKRIRDWWNYDPDSLDAFLERAEKANANEPKEIWQWQINCTSNRYPRHRPMPQNFGLLIGTLTDAEARLKACVHLSGEYEIKVNHYYSSEIITYEFHSPYEHINQALLMQCGAIRLVSENMKLLKTRDMFNPSNTCFIVEVKDYHSDFDFHPIKPQEQFITGKGDT